MSSSAENKRHRRRVKAKELIEEGTNHNVKKYLMLLYSAASNIQTRLGIPKKALITYA